MNRDTLTCEGLKLPVISVNTIIIGSGAAALNAAVNLVDRGQQDIAVVTEQWGGGTSNNAGSDKQTYYRLSHTSTEPDSPREMASDLFQGGCMHGDIALCEAMHSQQSFFHLVQLGVPFPHDQYGAFPGYQTDHDSRGRGTSAGPLTSQLMFECLAREVKRKKIRIFNHHEVIELLVTGSGAEKRVIGAVALNRELLHQQGFGLVIFNAENVILATGGPAGMYRESAYPASQTGAHGLALKIGAVGHNLTESQFGLASIKIRWNVSGSYQQVIPRYLSTDQEGHDEREFLNDYFPDLKSLTGAIFRKGYQWPFDPQKVKNWGSSLIDLLVHQEITTKDRRVFLDFRRNPSFANQEFDLNQIDSEAQDYLWNSDALGPTPFKRLKQLNQPAIEFYWLHGLDLQREPLEIAVCAQHNNGGLRGNIWWESNIKHLFPVGEVNGSHGVYRPGGAALNSGQVGSLRASMFIAQHYRTPPRTTKDFKHLSINQIQHLLRFTSELIDPHCDPSLVPQAWREFQERMSRSGALIRSNETVSKDVAEAWRQYHDLQKQLKIPSALELPVAFKTLGLCLTQAVYLTALAEDLQSGGKSRGSYLVLDPDGELPGPQVQAAWRFSLTSPEDLVASKILEINLTEELKIQKNWVEVRPIPVQDLWFEKVWREYRGEKHET